MNTAPDLSTDRLLLRGHCAADFAALAQIWSEPQTVKYITGRPSTDAESWSRLLRYAGHWGLLGYGYWAICRKEDGRYLGEAGFLRIDPPGSSGSPDSPDSSVSSVSSVSPAPGQPDESALQPEAGWILGSEYTRMGYGLEAMERILNWADSEARWATTECVITPDNVRSIAMANKLGFKKSGYNEKREADTYIRVNGNSC